MSINHSVFSEKKRKKILAVYQALIEAQHLKEDPRTDRAQRKKAKHAISTLTHLLKQYGFSANHPEKLAEEINTLRCNHHQSPALNNPDGTERPSAPANDAKQPSSKKKPKCCRQRPRPVTNRTKA